MQICVGHAGSAENFDTIVHTAAARPTVFDQSDRAIGEFQDAERLIFRFCLIAVNVRAHLTVNSLDWRASQEPVAKRDAVTAEVHERAAARTIHVPEPETVRPEMFFALLDEMNFAERAGIRHFLGFQIFWREEKLLTVQQKNAVAFRHRNHFFTLGNGHRQRFFANNVFTGRGDVFRHLRVQTIRRGDGNHFDVGLFQHLAVVGVHARDAKFLSQLGCIARCGRSDCHHFCVVRHDLKGCGLDVRLKLRTDDPNFYSTVAHRLSREYQLRVCASNYDDAGPWSSQPTYSFKIRLPLYSNSSWMPILEV